ncbi:MAG: hypothetical protein KF689_03640 [Gemmatimonadaceae bacterium]|nr:hypothetical protein [Gemmatimonadaceae bacterium]MCW5825726.1 hypothetical protein [Gemmatimonadaceae bacterium]
MPLQRAALAAAALALAGATVPLAAQADWNDERTQQLVGAAIQRRSVQLADTALRDYTARASGTLTFLAQFGDGFLSRPVVVKADQIELEVYWGAPDRSKQRIVGRRDTLLLPTDLAYHRDHLGIIQNNFPDIIRLGDGDEVLDVIHPLSPAGPLVYDYAIADSLVIRGTGLDLNVLMVDVRPKDPRRPAAVGALYIDRATSSVVRMTFSFTRAALRDRQLDDVSVILENGLVDGRFWLPRRQEIEIRRSASWMDFPAKGIIRGRWEICCVETNRSLPAPLFLGGEIVEAGPPAQLRQHPAFSGSVLDAIPDDARALDDVEVRAVQEEARRLVQEAALLRTRGANLAAGRISDFVRGDRVEGLAFGAGLSQRLGGGFTARVLGRYGSADERAKGRGSLAWQRASGWSLTVEGFDDWQQLGEVPEVSGVRNTLAAQEFGSDWTQPIGAVGGALRAQWAPPGRGRWSLEWRRQNERALEQRATPAFGRFEPTLPAAALTRDLFTLGYERSGSLGRTAAVGALLDSDWRFTSRLGGSQWALRDGSAEGSLLRAGIDLELSYPLGGTRLRLRSIAAATSAGGVPLQDRVLLGGPVSGPGYEFHAFAGRAGFSQRVELQRRIPFVPIDLGRFGRVPGSLVLAPFAHAVWVHDDLGGRSGWSPALGVGAIGLFDLLRVDVARGLRNGRWTFSLDLSRSLWPVL